MKRKKNEPPEKPVNLGRHQSGCKICNHLERAEIEADFISWKSPVRICQEYGLQDRTTIYRHAWALGLMEKRRRNIRVALERMIEKSGDVDVTASAIVAAIQAYAKINAQGQWIERKETVNVNELFEKMSREELLAYAERGELPFWYTEMVGATEEDSPETLIQ
jgi:hypothetical protein